MRRLADPSRKRGDMTKEGNLAKREVNAEVVRKESQSLVLDARKLSPQKINWVLSGALQGLHLTKEMLDAIKSEPTDTEFVLVINDAVKQGLESGELELMRRKTGEVLGAVTKRSGNSNKRVVAGLLDAVERTAPSIEPSQRMANITVDLANIAIQQQLSEIHSELKGIADAVERIERGQWTDRFSHISSAESALQSAYAMKNEDERRAEIQLARGHLQDGTAKISEAMKDLLDGVEPVPERRYQIVLKMLLNWGNYYDETRSWFNLIDDCSKMLDKAYMLLCLSAVALGEPKVIKITLDEYRDRLKEMDTEKLLSVGNINPKVDFSKEWFYDVDAYIDAKRGEMRLLTEGNHIAVVVTGEMLLEAVDGEAGERARGEGESVQENEQAHPVGEEGGDCFSSPTS